MRDVNPTLRQILMKAVQLGASDLHLSANSAPWIRLAGELAPFDSRVFSEEECRELILGVMTDEERHRFERNRESDFGFGIEGAARFRANVFLQRGHVAAVFRVVPCHIRSLEELGLPAVLGELVGKKKGLILVTGPSGSGKSTTLAALVDRINHVLKGHIITIEDPIEYLHCNGECLVSQREVNSDVKSFRHALRSILREDPDVVLIGEMRDAETVSSALRIAETGHLTLATLHANSAASTIHRIVCLFPPHQQEQVRGQLSLLLEGIICQRLLPNLDRSGCLVATEVLVPTLGIRNLIRESKDHQIYSLMQTGQECGMHTMNQSLVRLLSKRKISYGAAFCESPDIVELQEILPSNRVEGKIESNPKEMEGCLFTNSEGEILNVDHS